MIGPNTHLFVLKLSCCRQSQAFTTTSYRKGYLENRSQKSRKQVLWSFAAPSWKRFASAVVSWTISTSNVCAQEALGWKQSIKDYIAKNHNQVIGQPIILTSQIIMIFITVWRLPFCMADILWIVQYKGTNSHTNSPWTNQYTEEAPLSLACIWPQFGDLSHLAHLLFQQVEDPGTSSYWLALVLFGVFVHSK